MTSILCKWTLYFRDVSNRRIYTVFRGGVRVFWRIEHAIQTYQITNEKYFRKYQFFLLCDDNCTGISTIASIWRENMLGYLSVHIICSEKRSEANSENCELRETDNVQGQISEHIFAPNEGYCLYYPSNLFRNTHSFENWGIFSGVFGHVTRLDQSRASEKI